MSVKFTSFPNCVYRDVCPTAGECVRPDDFDHPPTCDVIAASMTPDGAALVAELRRRSGLIPSGTHVVRLTGVELDRLLALADEAIAARAENESLRRVRDAAAEWAAAVRASCPMHSERRIQAAAHLLLALDADAAPGEVTLTALAARHNGARMTNPNVKDGRQGECHGR
jgi:hypothetical protein